MRRGLCEQGKQCWPGKRSTVWRSMLAAVKNTHGPEQMAAKERDRQTDECWGYPALQLSEAASVRGAHLTWFSFWQQRGYRWNLLFCDIYVKNESQNHGIESSLV